MVDLLKSGRDKSIGGLSRIAGASESNGQRHESFDPSRPADIKALLDRGAASPFQGRTNEYGIYTFRSGPKHGFVERTKSGLLVVPGNKDLAVVIDRLYRSVYPERAEKNPELTTERILKGLSYPNTILTLIMFGELPVGFGIFPRLEVGAYREPVLYSSRAIIKAHEHEGVGTHVLERAISLQQRDSLRFHKPLRHGMLMTQSWKSVRSLEHLKETGSIEKIQPLDEPYDRLGKDILFGVHSQVWVNSEAIDETGLSRGELSEVGENETVESPKRGTRGDEIDQSMVRRPPNGAGMIAKDGDVIYYHFWLPERYLAAA